MKTHPELLHVARQARRLTDSVLQYQSSEQLNFFSSTRSKSDEQDTLQRSIPIW